MQDETRKASWGVGLITCSVDRSVVEMVLAYQPPAAILSSGDPRLHAAVINVKLDPRCRVPVE